MIDKKKAMAYVKEYLKNTEHSLEYKNSEDAYWLPDAKHAFEHTKRVHSYVKLLNHFVKDKEFEPEIVEIAAIFHDVAKFDSLEEHARVSSEVAREYFKSEQIDSKYVDKICQAIANHSKKTTDEEVVSILSMEDKVLIDADMLSEAGVKGLFWIAMKEGSQELSFERCISKANEGLNYMNDFIKIAHTQKARELLIKNTMLAKGIIHTLETEIRGDIV